MEKWVLSPSRTTTNYTHIDFSMQADRQNDKHKIWVYKNLTHAKHSPIITSIYRQHNSLLWAPSLVDIKPGNVNIKIISLNIACFDAFTETENVNRSTGSEVDWMFLQ